MHFNEAQLGNYKYLLGCFLLNVLFVLILFYLFSKRNCRLLHFQFMFTFYFVSVLIYETK